MRNARAQHDQGAAPVDQRRFSGIQACHDAAQRCRNGRFRYGLALQGLFGKAARCNIQSRTICRLGLNSGQIMPETGLKDRIIHLWGAFGSAGPFALIAHKVQGDGPLQGHRGCDVARFQPRKGGSHLRRQGGCINPAQIPALGSRATL